jgi:hypothetical protein
MLTLNPRRLNAVALSLSLLALMLLVLQLSAPALWQVARLRPHLNASLGPSGGGAARPAGLRDANAAVPAYAAPFRYGINFGWRDGWDNIGLATISAEAGATSARLKLPEWLFEEYGYDVEFENNDMETYRKLGLVDLTAFLIGPTREHSNAPPDEDPERYSPKNLYKPIWLSPGKVNPENYWASYVFKTVSKYKDHVKIWEVWNEPDFVNDWEPTQTDWWQRPPDPEELVGWHDSIFAYVRLMRISYEVIKYVDPDGFVAPGGLGYESFLDGILRYTDNPKDGSVTPEYAAKGGAYFDVISFHHYPEYAIQDQETGEWYRETDSDAAAASFALKVRNMRRPLLAHGYDGKTYPEKYWICTETGIASKVVGKQAGGPELMKNYLAKMVVVAQALDIKQVHWFSLSDQEDRNAAGESQFHMGLYYDVKNVKLGKQTLKPEAASYPTLSRLLRDHWLDMAASEALGLPSEARGYVFVGPDGRKSTVLWAATANSSEQADATVALASAGDLLRHDIGAAANAAPKRLSPSGGKLRVPLTATPTVLTEAPRG